MASSLPPIGSSSTPRTSPSSLKPEPTSKAPEPAPHEKASAGVAGAQSAYTEASGEPAAAAPRSSKTRKAPREEFGGPGPVQSNVHDPFLGTQACSDDHLPGHGKKPVQR